MSESPLLEEGDWIKVHGFVMLKGLKGGKEYEVEEVFTHKGSKAYELRPKYTSSWKSRVKHYVYDIDKWINMNSDINYIEIMDK